MPDFTASIDIFAPADRVFDYISDVTHLPEYSPIVTRAESQPFSNRVQVRGEANGRPFDVGGIWRLDRAAMRVEWTADSNPDYGGSLGVTREGRACRVDGLLRFRVWTPEEIKQGGEREWQLLVQHDLEQTLHTLKEILERRGRVSTPAAAAPTG